MILNTNDPQIYAGVDLSDHFIFRDGPRAFSCVHVYVCTFYGVAVDYSVFANNFYVELVFGINDHKHNPLPLTNLILF